MSLFSLTGRVVQATDLAPLGGVALRLHGPATAFAGVAAVQAIPQGRQVTWTRALSGFAGTRWDCWTQQVQGKVTSITWEQFRDGSLLHNPALNPDHLFKADQSYLLPEESAAPSFTWTRQLTGFTGTRWDCWTNEVQPKVASITWLQFVDNALLYNPQLNADGRVFQPTKSYLVPQTDTTQRAYLETTTDPQGNYSFTLGEIAATYELQVEIDNYARFVLPLVVNGAITQPIQLVPQPLAVGATSSGAAPTISASGSVRSTRTDYATMPDKARRVIDMALFMLGDDPQVFDALPPELQRMTYGSRFLNNPGDFHYKDIVCADLVSVVFKNAGLDITWGGGAGPSMADYYFPLNNGKLLEINDPSDWLIGDVLVYGPSFTAGRQAGHVNLYVGSFAGTDRSGRSYALPENNEVVEASMDFMSQSKEVGTGIQGRTLTSYCLDKMCYTYQWVKRVRLRELAASFGR